jgi:hypothetical protein
MLVSHQPHRWLSDVHGACELPPADGAGAGCPSRFRAGQRHGGRTPAGVMARVAQRVLALAAAIWHNWATDAPVKRSLIATAAAAPITCVPACRPLGAGPPDREVRASGRVGVQLGVQPGAAAGSGSASGCRLPPSLVNDGQRAMPSAVLEVARVRAEQLPPGTPPVDNSTPTKLTRLGSRFVSRRPLDAWRRSGWRSLRCAGTSVAGRNSTEGPLLARGTFDIPASSDG